MRILYATDGSEGARLAGAALAGLGLASGTPVTVLYVLTRYVPTDAHLPRDMVASLRADEDARAAAVLHGAARLLAAAGLAPETRTVEGHPARSIVETAEADGADLVVTGALGLSGWRRLLLGSVSTAVVKHAPCAVWVVKTLPKAGPMDVLVATDGSEGARDAIRTLCTLPLPEGSVAHLVHVVPSVNAQLHLTGSPLDPPVLEPVYEVGHHLRAQGERVLKEDAAALAARFAEVRPFIEEGEVRRTILRAAQEVEADLIVLGSKGLSGVREFLLGSVSHKVLKHAQTSVLVVPAPPPTAP